jgi:hypothetical protein
MSGNVIRVPARSLKEQFSRGSEAWQEQSDPIFRFWTEGDWWGFPFFSVSASRYFGDKETLCLYWPLGTVVITGPKALDFYAEFCAHRATSVKIGWERHLLGNVGAELRAFAFRFRECIVVPIESVVYHSGPRAHQGD